MEEPRRARPPALGEAIVRSETVSYRSHRAAEACAGSLEEWLTARYFLYASDGDTLFRAEIEHEPWTLRRARAELFRNTMADSAGILLPAEPPLLHYSQAFDVRVRWPERAGAADAPARA